MTTSEIMKRAAEFKLGVWEHYKGGRYTVIMLVRHHDTGLPMVVYVSHEKGSINCRPLVGWRTDELGLPHDEDGFLDELRLPDRPNDIVPRFVYIGPAKS